MARFSLGSDWRRLFWMGSLILLSVAFSLGFSCAVPLAPFATIGALTLRRHDAFVLIGAVWLANQMTGFALLHYPLERTAFAWGLALGAVAVLATCRTMGQRPPFGEESRPRLKRHVSCGLRGLRRRAFCDFHGERKRRLEFCSSDRPAYIPHQCRCLCGAPARAPTHRCQRS